MRMWVRADWIVFVLWCVILVVLSVLFLFAGQADAEPLCHPSEAIETEVVYAAAGDNTAVKLRTYCAGTSAEWYVSFFIGEQPTLREFAEIQNTAGKLLRGG